uniref:type 2 isopentenyl-diphosphate Delta-isomerase n=1 Tax=Herbidospora sakaeratensis TaxID=564415 RepID=UPI0007C660F1|nr:type 2 isopentenyl-diphosphate Delta-isomerase [Herbidospora sakaeratensis]
MPDVADVTFETRKSDHLRLALDERNEATGLHDLDLYHLTHDSLPELDFDEIGIAARALGRESPTPFYVAGMTAGHAAAPAINRRLAEGCARHGWIFGVGSQRRELDDPGLTVDRWRTIREDFPNLSIVANVGAAQLAESPSERIVRLAEVLDARAIAVHLNPLQECLQPEGTPRFRGVVSALRRLTEASDIPVVVKETGCGFGERALGKLASLPIAAVDLSGLGGTHWGRIEGARAGESGDAVRAEASVTFRDWGEPTATSLLPARAILPPAIELWASGGVRSGLDAAKLIALGASQVGYARPALSAALAGADHLDAWMTQQEYELRVALFCTGSATPRALYESAILRGPHITTGKRK